MWCLGFRLARPRARARPRNLPLYPVKRLQSADQLLWTLEGPAAWLPTFPALSVLGITQLTTFRTEPSGVYGEFIEGEHP